jgi:hypothetical protein
MISFYLAGGLCNMLFQTATAEWIAKKYGKNVCYVNAREHFKFLTSFGKWVSHSREYHGVFRFVDWFKNYEFYNTITDNKQIGFPYRGIVPKDGVNYMGYFQSDKNFDGAFARALFTPTNFVNQRVDELSQDITGVTCSLHVRRGNYVELQDHHILLGKDYYDKAMAHMRELGVEKFVVFSDDISWCRETFKGDEFIFKHDVDYVELFLMGKCTHNIIANSSFSWWGHSLATLTAEPLLLRLIGFPTIHLMQETLFLIIG